MLVSVVIPVYKAEEYVHEAVLSALRQPETGEVVLVEDNSPDKSLMICQDLVRSNQRVRLFRHPGGGNRGAGASRNLGIRSASCEYVAFLDADDYYLDSRFSEARKLFSEHDDIDGVYEAVGTYFQDRQARENWSAWGRAELQTMHHWIPPEGLFDALLSEGKGWLHLNGLVAKRDVFDRCGYFFEHLRLHQDTALFLQLAAFSRLYPGRLKEAVAMRRVHAHNRMPGANPETRALFCRTLFHWAVEHHLEKAKIVALFHDYLYFSYAAIRRQRSSTGLSHAVKGFVKEALGHPALAMAAMGRHFRGAGAPNSTGGVHA